MLNRLTYTVRRIAVTALAACALAYASGAAAWGVDGHRAIALMAYEQLTPSAKASIDKLMEQQEPGQTFAGLSTWADEIVSPATGPWHYVNFPRGTCSPNQAFCLQGNCVIEAINAQADLLRNSKDAAERYAALKFVVHFVGDVHQPLHAGLLDDRGGNSYQVQAGGEGSNLHRVWDSYILRQRGLMPAQIAKAFMSSKPASLDQKNSREWAVESCNIVAQTGFYPESRIIDDAYVQRFAPVVQLRMTQAAMRLAALLNDMLTDKPTSAASGTTPK